MKQKIRDILDLDVKLQRQTVSAAWPEAFTRLRLPFGASRALLVLDNGDARTPSEIADVLKVSRTSVTGMLDRLEAENLIRRAIDPKDRRSFLLELTDAGQDLVREIDNLRRNPLTRALELMDDDSLDLLFRGLEALTRAMSMSKQQTLEEELNK